MTKNASQLTALSALQAIRLSATSGTAILFVCCLFPFQDSTIKNRLNSQSNVCLGVESSPRTRGARGNLPAQKHTTAMNSKTDRLTSYPPWTDYGHLRLIFLSLSLCACVCLRECVCMRECVFACEANGI